MPIYLDGYSSTPLAPEAKAAMDKQWLRQANSGSPNIDGRFAAEAVADARSSLASLINGDSAEIIFTSGATEANNLAVIGGARALAQQTTRRQIVVSSIEHSSVLEPAQSLSSAGFEVSICPVNEAGVIDLNFLDQVLSERTALVSVMSANNETGVVQPIREVAARCRNVGALVHTDAAQAAGKLPLDVFELDVDYMSLSAHKMYGPQGVGALFVSAAAPAPEPILLGGGQEAGRRSGTTPAALIAGMGAAALLAQRQDGVVDHVRSLASLFLSELHAAQVRYVEIADEGIRLPGGLALRLLDVDVEMLCQVIAPELTVSAGSACSSGQLQQSHVLRAMGFDSGRAREYLRLLFGRYNTEGDARLAARIIAKGIRKAGIATGEVNQ